MSQFDEIEWVDGVRRALEEAAEVGDEEQQVMVSISDVPKALASSKPEAYVPQTVALGPYHSLRGELRDAERYKLFAAGRTQSQLPHRTFQRLVNLFLNLEHQIRAHYHRYLKFSGETLAWMMAIDASFLLEFLRTFAINNGGQTSRLRRTWPHALLLRDIMMLENQIPLFLLRSVLELQHSSSERLSSLLIGFFNEISPFQIPANFPLAGIDQCCHLLGLLYSLLVPVSSSSSEEEEEQEQLAEDCAQVIQPHKFCLISRKVLDFLFTRAKAFLLAIVKFSVKVPLRIFLSLPVLSAIKPLIEQYFKSTDDPAIVSNRRPSSPLLDEISIPCVKELKNAGITFSPIITGDISKIEFIEKQAMLYLPAIALDAHTDVVLRNLVAYEAAINGVRPLVFSRYIELMNGIVDTAEDARILREAGVMENHLKSDEEVAEIWNGMTRSVRLTRVASLDRVIEEVNRYYNGRWKVKGGRFVKRHLKPSKSALHCLEIRHERRPTTSNTALNRIEPVRSSGFGNSRAGSRATISGRTQRKIKKEASSCFFQKSATLNFPHFISPFQIARFPEEKNASLVVGSQDHSLSEVFEDARFR